MKGKRPFLRWSLFAILIVIGAIMAVRLGWAEYLRDDPTHITYVTLATFVLATAWCGRLCWRLSSKQDLAAVQDGLEHGWFASSLCVSIGLVGTAVGYYLMLRGGMSDGDPQTIIRTAFANTSVAIVNTVCGGVCGVLVEIQSHFIGTAIATARREAS